MQTEEEKTMKNLQMCKPLHSDLAEKQLTEENTENIGSNRERTNQGYNERTEIEVHLPDSAEVEIGINQSSEYQVEEVQYESYEEDYSVQEDEYIVVMEVNDPMIDYEVQDVIIKDDTSKKQSEKQNELMTCFEKTQKCPKCYKKFDSISSFKRHHYRMHRMIRKKYHCTYQRCQETFNCGYKLNVHLRRHENIRPFVCDICTKSFFDKAYLVEHMRRIHMTELLAEYSCDKCSKVFSLKAKLRIHQRNHSESARKHVCKVCDKKFITREKLTRHELVHSDSRPYVCSLCSNGYKSSYALKNHMKKCSL